MRSLSLDSLLVMFALAALALVAPASALAAPAKCDDANKRPGRASEAVLAKSTVCLLNRERAEGGLRKLRMNRRLSRAAFSHTVDMVDQRYFEHVSKAGLDVVDRLTSTGYLGRVSSWAVGENLAWGTGARSTPRRTVIAWMDSPSHRRNILSRRFREIGIGVVFHAPVNSAPVAATYTTTFGYRR